MANIQNQDTEDELIAWMKDPRVDYTYGWSAVAAYDREKANNLLKQEYADRYSSEDFLEPIKRGFDSVDADEKIWLGGVTYDAPRLSFDNSTLNDSAATLTWQAIDGSRFNLLNQSFKGHPTHWQVIQIAYENGLAGARLVQTVKLETTKGAVDNAGEVYLDIAKPDTRDLASYNLAPAPRQQQAAAAELQAWLKEKQGEPGNLTRFVLSKVVPDEKEFFNPTDFMVRIHPSARSTRDASGASDGAVLVFIQSHEADEGTPPNDNLRYLIPQGYSATLALAPQFMLRRYLEMTVKVLNPDGKVSVFPSTGIPQYAQFEAGTFNVDEATRNFEMWTQEKSWFDLHVLSDLTFSNVEKPGENIRPFRVTLTPPDADNDAIGLQVTWAGSQDIDFTSKRRIGGEVQSNKLKYFWDITWRYTIELNARTNDLEIKEGRKTTLHKATPIAFGSDLQRLESHTADYFETQWFTGRMLRKISDALAAAVMPLNAMRLNQLLFQSKAPVKLETLRMADAPVVFGQVSPSRTRFSIKLSRDGREEVDAVLAGENLRLIIENTDTAPQSVTWSLEVAYGEVKGDAFGEVTGSANDYTYKAPALTDLVSDYLIVRLTATARFAQDRGSYVVKSFIKVYASAVATSAIARVMSKGKNFYVNVNGLGVGEVIGTIDSPSGPENEALVKDSSMEGFNWRYVAPSGTTETDDNEPGVSDKPKALGYRCLRFTQDGKSTNISAVVPYVTETLAILVVGQEVQGDYTLLTLQALWTTGKNQEVLPGDNLSWTFPLNREGAELNVQGPDKAILKLSNALRRSYVAVEVRVFDSALLFDSSRRQALVDQRQKSTLRRPGDETEPDYVGVRLFPLPWVDVPEPPEHIDPSETETQPDLEH